MHKGFAECHSEVPSARFLAALSPFGGQSLRNESDTEEEHLAGVLNTYCYKLGEVGFEVPVDIGLSAWHRLNAQPIAPVPEPGQLGQPVAY